MCGIVGYVGGRDAVPILLEGLTRLEYRGYDSAGLAVFDAGAYAMRRNVGRLDALRQTLADAPLAGTPGIGHTRWATHGAPSARNCHPHTDSTGRIALVHNGIIENCRALRAELTAAGHTFRSETDTEVIPRLIEEALRGGAADVRTAFLAVCKRLSGSYALAMLCADEPGTLFAARLGSPLVIGCGDGEHFIASDVPALQGETERVVYLDDGELAAVTADGLTVCSLAGEPRVHKVHRVRLDPQASSKAGFDKFMLKEIHEQPRVLRGLLGEYLGDAGEVRFPDLTLTPQTLRGIRRLGIVSCGTAYYAAMLGKLLIERFTGIAVDTDLASEFRYREPKLEAVPLLVAISQSGETADTLASVRLAREKGCRALAICNVPGSTLVRESDAVIYTCAGPEIGVASTKAYTAQLMCLALLAIHMGRTRGELAEPEAAALLRELARVPDAVHYVLARSADIDAIARKHHGGPSALYLGRNFNYPTALEGALKNKEISYQHAEGYAAGEMKHGPIALVDEYLPVVCVCTRTEGPVYEKVLSNVREAQARSGRIIALATDGDTQIEELAEDIIFVPETIEPFSPIVNVVALQLLAYYAALARGSDIDKPRNLAKSVTVE